MDDDEINKYCTDTDDSEYEIDEKIYKFTLKDYLKFPYTRNALIYHHHQKFLETCEPKLKKQMDNIYDYCQNQQMASVLRLDLSKRGVGHIIGMIYKYIKKDYDLEIFEKRPELIQPLIAAKQKEKNNR